MSASLEIQLLAVLVAAACALPGVFLVLRGTAVMADAISHTVLLGIVLVIFVVQDLQSPWLIVGAAAIGLVTVTLTELLQHTRLVKQDAAIGLVFPALFSLAVILISRFARDVHLDVDAVLLGELAFAPFDRLIVLGIDVPRALVTIAVVLVANIAFISLFYKELKLATFDAGLAATLGFAPALLHYGLMALVSIAAVGAFDIVGVVLVVALMVTPAAAAYLLTSDLRRMLVLSVAIGVLSAIAGYWLARLLNANIAGAMATMTGVLFLIVLMLAPQRGILAKMVRRRRQQVDFAATMLAIHLLHHTGAPTEAEEARIDHLEHHLDWQPGYAARVIRHAERLGFIKSIAGHLQLTPTGSARAQEVLAR